MENDLQAYYANQNYEVQAQMLVVHEKQEAERKRLEAELVRQLVESLARH